MIEMENMGLNDQEVHERVLQGQVNFSSDNISKTKKQIVIDHTFTYFNFLNLALALIVLYTGRYKNMMFMFVVIINSIIGIYQELKVKKIIDKLSVVTATKANVIRNHKMISIPVEELVLDDVVYLEAGDQISSDCFVLDVEGLEVNEALITGESQPIRKQLEDELLAGSFVVAGQGYARVIRIGHDNYSTQLVYKAKHKNRASSEMKNAIEKVIKILSFVIVPIGLILFLSQIKALPMDVDTAIVRTVAGVIGMIPEGLVLLTSLSFIVGVGRLARKKALIQEMEAIEALARVDVLCLDKTGTITTGELEVDHIDYVSSLPQQHIDELMSVMSYAFLENTNATQEGLRRYFSCPLDVKVEQKIPFSSQRKMQAMVYHGLHYVLGAPEFLLERDHPLLQRVNEYSNKGYRVLLFASTDFIDSETYQTGTQEPLAFIIMRDQLKDDARDVLSFFYHMGVDVRILSGDNPITVACVAQLAHMKHAESFIDASSLSDEELNDDVITNCHIFGRVTPEQKQKIISSLQSQGHIVGMVGDGVNDVLALKDADCGIAMASGSDAVKQAAHIVLLDSQFTSMKDIVQEGREIIGDIERVSSLYLTKTTYSTLLCLIFAFLHMSYPFTPFQLSLISGLAIGIPSFLLTFERSSKVSLDGFLKHVISTAVPCGLTMVVYMLGITFIGHTLQFGPKLLSTYYFAVAGFISFLVVYIVCRPLNRMRSILLIVIVSLFYSILFLLYPWFDIYSLWRMDTIWIIPLCASTLFVLPIIQTMMKNIYIRHEQRLKKIFVAKR